MIVPFLLLVAACLVVLCYVLVPNFEILLRRTRDALIVVYLLSQLL